MIDLAENYRSGALAEKPDAVSSLDQFTLEELLLLRAEIDARLPARKLREMDLERELVVQYQRVKLMQEEILNDPEEGTGVPVNQKAQVINSVASLLQQLNKVQDEKYTAERFKQIESLLVELLNSWPDEQTKEFFQQYEKLL